MHVIAVASKHSAVIPITENMANILAGKLSDRGVPVEMFDTSVIPASYIIASAFKNSHLVFAATTYNAGIFVTMENLIHDVVAHSIKNRKVALLENGSWGPMSGKLMTELLSKLPGVSFMQNPITIKSSVKPSTLDELDALADLIADDIFPNRHMPKEEAPVIKETAPAPVTKAEVSVDPTAFFKFSYGLEVLTTRNEDRDYGCIINSAAQVSEGELKKVAVSVINKNNTCDMIKASGRFNISVLTEEAPFSIFQHFGFQSGRDVDKFTGAFDLSQLPADINGIPYLKEHACSVISCRVLESHDLGSHTLFIAEIEDAILLNDKKPLTYADYQNHVKPKPDTVKTDKKIVGWKCKICGYV